MKVKHTRMLEKLFLPPLLVLCLLLASCTESVAPVYQGPDIQIIGHEFYKDLEFEFKRHSYQLDALDKGVPSIILKSLPGDLHQIRSGKQKKTFFFKALLPMVLLANDEIRFEREQLLKTKKVLASQQHLTSAQMHILSSLAERYKIKLDPEAPDQAINKLLHRIDIIPADLVLAQAANESGWGTSRFSRVANNLFGEWTFIQGQGIIPEGRPEGETYEVQKFATVYESVRSYLQNLNSHAAYKPLRQIRAESRSAGINPDGLKLAEGLLRYSVRGEDYVRELQAMIRKNKLSRFASTKLRTRG
ncbi:MAG: glucosaminidase domain-containing protein [Deltaproteobacteria bacterium]|nr:glucosaminidase domain-containing protein [Deltaproteobacteria bacterium]